LIGEIKVHCVGDAIRKVSLIWKIPFLYNSAWRYIDKLLFDALKPNVVEPNGDPFELNVNTFDVVVKAGVLVNPLILLTVKVGEGNC
jgi:hypothetical protein